MLCNIRCLNKKVVSFSIFAFISFKDLGHLLNLNCRHMLVTSHQVGSDQDQSSQQQNNSLNSELFWVIKLSQFSSFLMYTVEDPLFSLVHNFLVCFHLSKEKSGNQVRHKNCGFCCAKTLSRIHLHLLRFKLSQKFLLVFY